MDINSQQSFFGSLKQYCTAEATNTRYSWQPLKLWIISHQKGGAVKSSVIFCSSVLISCNSMHPHKQCLWVKRWRAKARAGQRKQANSRLQSINQNMSCGSKNWKIGRHQISTTFLSLKLKNYLTPSTEQWKQRQALWRLLKSKRAVECISWKAVIKRLTDVF